MVPVRLNALRVEQPTPVRSALANFTNLPFHTSKRDVNAGRAYLSEDIVAQPFDDSFVLDPGVHLHWALPDALTRSLDNAEGGDGELDFPTVPNLWQITRVLDDQPDSAKAWIVESDYVHSVADGPQSGAVAFPIRQGDGDGPPYRHLGRVLGRSEWRALQGGYQTLRDVTISDRHPHGQRLTALGYGEPTFAAYYPNCHSLFGFCDPDPAPAGHRAKYYVVGWYRDATEDFCNRGPDDATFARRFKDSYRHQNPWPAKASKHASFLHQAWAETYRWEVAATPSELPRRSAYYACVDLAQAAPAKRPQGLSGLSVAVGNTPTEALAAYLSETQLGPSNQTEDRLQALGLMGEIDHLRIDTGPKFEEARHARGFQAVPAGDIYKVVRKPVEKPVASPSNGAQKDAKAAPVDSSQITLDAAHAHLLNTLNSAQIEWLRASAAVTSMQRQVFADWYRYMLAAYPPDGQAELFPDIDAARYLIERFDFARLDRLTGQADALAAQVDLACKALKASLPEDQMVKPVAAPRFWQPTEPVVLLAGDALKPSDRHGNKEALPCWVAKVDAHALLAQKPDFLGQLRTHFETTTPNKSDIGPQPYRGLSVYDPLDWHSLLLEWQADVMPLEDSALGDGLSSRIYHKTFIADAYVLDQNSVDLVQKPKSEALASRPATLQGINILTPQAKPRMLDQIGQYLKSHLWPFYRENHAQTATTFDKMRQEAVLWFGTLGPNGRADLRYRHEYPDAPAPGRKVVDAWYSTSGYAGVDDFIDHILTAEERAGPGFHALAQGLTGFNAALLGQKQTLQLPVADPLAFPDDTSPKLADYRAFAAKVANKLGKQNRWAPQPMAGFHPLRSGEMRLQRLRLVDTFGRSVELDRDRVQNPAVSRMIYAGADKGRPKGKIVLPPRMIQPMRLNLRWLSADPGPGAQGRDDREANHHPAATPVCGWLVPNNLDNSLSVHDASGRLLGVLDMFGGWRPSPFLSADAAAQPIANPHLAKVVAWLKNPNAGTTSITQPLISALGSALENIDPSGWAAHQDIALIMGQPLAVVRASVGLEMEGTPALNPDLELYRQSLNDGPDYRMHSGMVETIRFPVRLGEHRQLNDGLAGYWLEDEFGRLGDTFASPQSNAGPHGVPLGDAALAQPPLTTEDLNKSVGDLHVRCSNDRPGPLTRFNLELSMSSRAQTVTMLMDPRGKLHATAGIVPTKAIDIPPDQYAPALKDIEVTIRTTPVLTARRPQTIPPPPPVDLPLPAEPGYTWQWLQPTGHGPEIHDKIGNVTTEATFETGNHLVEGWLVLRRAADPPENLPANDPSRRAP